MADFTIMELRLLGSLLKNHINEKRRSHDTNKQLMETHEKINYKIKTIHNNL